MSQEPLVSIIIPTFNRAHLIGETLDSVLAQTYQNWECIVVDDGSTDETDAVMKTYCDKDSRFKYYHRPEEHLPGGNGARNYGFKMSRGEYIQWFDSDDLMVPEKIELKVKAMLENDVDFLISQTKYFNAPPNVKQYQYRYKTKDINLMSYTKSGLSWFTPDMFIKRSVNYNVKFNEELKSGQEGNFSYKLLIQNYKALKVDQYLTLRRYHHDSIGVKRRSDVKKYLRTTFESNWITFNELIDNYSVPYEFKKFVLLRGVKLYYKHGKIKIDTKFHARLWEVFGVKIIYFYFGTLTNFMFNKYLFFYSKLK